MRGNLRRQLTGFGCIDAKFRERRRASAGSARSGVPPGASGAAAGLTWCGRLGARAAQTGLSFLEGLPAYLPTLLFVSDFT